MGICSFILASQEPWCEAVCWIQVWISPTGFFTSDYTEKRPSLHAGACLCQGFKEPLRLHPQWICEMASVPQKHVCSKCYNANLPLYNYMPSGKILALYLHNLVWSGPLRHTKHFAHNSAKLVCVSVTELQNVVIRAYGQSAISILIFFMVG